MSTGGQQTQPALSTPFATPMADAPVLKRRRTTAACNSCRAKKSKVSMLPLQVSRTMIHLEKQPMLNSHPV